ncbi:unnamed protein product [Phytophthora lilii]|uniref:Unnamed protein product n=1 Tax=Phytophthora lilii TaxID=2077276 RepID=A0A9W6WLF3_9STRA|nr:unnamed protein product [Phytophthora lilii]
MRPSSIALPARPLACPIAGGPTLSIKICSLEVQGLAPAEQVTSPSARASALGVMEQLPPDALKVLSSFLTGQDAFNLSHSSAWWLEYVADGSFWQRRLQSSQAWHKRFMVAPSLLFRGRQTANNLQLDSFAYLVDMKQSEPSHFHLTRLTSFSFDVWFSLLSASDAQCYGGIIYGLQSAERASRPWPHYHQPIVVVNASGDLHCSLLDDKPVVARNLVSSRWYHLALAYDHDLQWQDVYLDGELVWSDTGPLHEEWRYLTHEQVGTGCVTGGDQQFPYRGYLGWYGFHGIIDEFRVWETTLQESEVVELAHGGRLSSERLRGSLKLVGSETTTWQGEVSARQQYVQSRSMRFKALKVENMADELDAFMYLTYVPGRYQRGRQYPLLFTLTHMGAESFSFDVWFSLLPASSNEFAGGIILGLQSDTRTEGHWPHYHQQFVMVSSTGEFYCSVLSEKVVAANNLESNRWYHVALTYDHDHQHQQVFLDGLKIRSEPGSRHHEWSRLMYGQVGTGCVTSDTLNCPRPGHIGWYGFNGIIDCFRVWGGVLSQDDVVQLARGGELPAERLRASTARQTDSISSRSLQLNVRQRWFGNDSSKQHCLSVGKLTYHLQGGSNFNTPKRAFYPGLRHGSRKEWATSNNSAKDLA